MSSAQRVLAALRSSLQLERSSLHAAAHTNNGDAAPSTALSTFGATGELKVEFFFSFALCVIATRTSSSNLFHLPQSHGLHMEGLDHVTPLTHFNSTQMAQISPPQPIFISTEGRPNQMELLHRTARRITAARRNFTRFHWSPTHAPPHPHARHPIQAQIPHQTPLPLQTASAYSGILLNFL